jgi:beta-lactamase regulating signal transducer with metallopeptidase domain/uncharacterized GH25 family protein
MNIGAFQLLGWNWDTLVRAMLHSLWQGSTIALLLWLVLRWLPARWTGPRYLVCFGAQMAVLIAVIATASVLGRTAPAFPRPTQGIAFEGGGSAPSPVIGSGDIGNALGTVTHSWPWTTWIGWAWACGSALALVRTATRTIRAGRLAGSGTPVVDDAILALVARLAAAMHIRRRIRVVCSTQCAAPGVVGFIWATLLIPSSMLSGVPPEQLSMILAHELAHVRRWDYLLNVWQQLVEAPLFFNPAVWWIGRQIRREREACCDALAVQVTGDARVAAQALADFAEQLIPTRSTPALGADGGSPGDLLERVRRILRPDDRLSPALPWYSTAAALICGLTLLVLLGSGIDAAVAEAQVLLTPAQRIDRIKTLQEAIAEAQRFKKPDCELNGTIQTEDRSPLPLDAQVLVLVHGGGYSSSFGETLTPDRAGHFAERVQAGFADLAIDVAGYAPLFAGSFEGTPGGSFPPIDLQIDRGFPAVVRVVDPAGKPLAGATVDSVFVNPVFGRSSYIGKQRGTTDANGVLTIEHATSAATARIEVTRGGFQVGHERVTLNPNVPTTIRLRVGIPTTGVIVDAGTGQPIAGATIRLAASDGFSNSQPDDFDCYWLHEPNLAPVTLGVSDANGKFNLTTLRDDSNYSVWILAPGHGSELLRGVHLGQRGLTVRLGPERIIRGRITGDLTQLAKSAQTGGLVLRSMTSAWSPTDPRSEYLSEGEVPVTVSDGVGTFTIDDPAPGSVELFPPGLESDSVKTEDVIAHGPFNFDIPAVATTQAAPGRIVIFQFDVPAGSPPPAGSLYVSHLDVRQNSYSGVVVPIVGGVVRYEAKPPMQVGYSGTDLVGYCIVEKYGIVVGPGSGPLVIHIPAVPAGAARGRVLEPDGTPCHSFSISGWWISGSGPDGMPVRLQPNNVWGASGTFLLTPIPFGSRYRFLASSDDRLILSDIYDINEATPIRDITFRFAVGRSLLVHVVGPDGQPAAGAMVSLLLTVRNYDGSYIGAARKTDRDGNISFDHVNDVDGGQYNLVVSPGWNWAGQTVEVDVNGKTKVIKLVAGLKISGQAINKLTNQPISGATINANPDPVWDQPPPQPTSTVADAQGQFTFNNLAAGDYRLFVGDYEPPGVTVIRNAAGVLTGYSLPAGATENLVHAGQAASVTLRVYPYHMK